MKLRDAFIYDKVKWYPLIGRLLQSRTVSTFERTIFLNRTSLHHDFTLCKHVCDI